MEVQLDTIRDLPPYLAPIDLAQKAQPLLSKLRFLHKRLRKARKRARKNKKELEPVWRIEREIRDYVKQYKKDGLCCLTREECERRLEGWEEEEEALKEEVSFWDDLSLGTVVSHFRELALEQASKPVANPYRNEEYNQLLRTLTEKRPKWKQVQEALVFVARAQRKRLHELHLMFENIALHKTPFELSAWVDAIEAVTELKDDPYESLREGSFWLTDGLGLVGFWTQKHLWQRTRRQEKAQHWSLIATELLSASAVISVATLSDLDSFFGAVAHGIAMPHLGYLPYIAYVSYRIRELTGGLPKDLNRVTWQGWIFFSLIWLMMLGPNLIHRVLPRKIRGYLQLWRRERRLKRALQVYVDALLEGDRKGHFLTEMLKVRHQLSTLRRRFEVVPLTVIPELSGEHRYFVIDLGEATKHGSTRWLRDLP